MRRTAPRSGRRRPPARADSAPHPTGRSARAISPRNSVGQHQRRRARPSSAVPNSSRDRAQPRRIGPRRRARSPPRRAARPRRVRARCPGRPRCFLDQIVAPAFEMVGPGLDRVAPAPDPVRPETRRSSGHCRRTKTASPATSSLLEGVFEHGRDLVVPVAENIGPDRDLVADHPLDRIAPAIDLGPDSSIRMRASGRHSGRCPGRGRHPGTARSPPAHRPRRARAAPALRAARRGTAPAPALAPPRQGIASSTSRSPICQPGRRQQLPARPLARLALLRVDQNQARGRRRSRSAAAARAAGRRAATGGAAAPPR